MKELSIEEKAKRYDEAIKVARQYYNDRAMPIGTNFKLEKMFPELKESDDKRIIKRIIQALHGDVLDMEETNKAIAWLEKQDEHDIGISEATKQKLEDNLHKALEKETPESWNEFLDEQGEQKTNKCMYSKDNYTDEDRKVLCDGCEEDCKFKQKPEWSEEDEERLSDAIFFVREYQIPTRDKRLFNAAKKTEDWLRTFKDKVQLKPEWSEEDERERKRVVGLLEGWLSTFKETCYAEDCKCGIVWLKSLRPRKQWKPSDEQIEAIKDAIEFLGCTKKVREDLKSLYEQLLKLRE